MVALGGGRVRHHKTCGRKQLGSVEEGGSEGYQEVLFTSVKLPRRKVSYLRPAFLFPPQLD